MGVLSMKIGSMWPMWWWLGSTW